MNRPTLSMLKTPEHEMILIQTVILTDKMITDLWPIHLAVKSSLVIIGVYIQWLWPKWFNSQYYMIIGGFI